MFFLAPLFKCTGIPIRTDLEDELNTCTWCLIQTSSACLASLVLHRPTITVLQAVSEGSAEWLARSAPTETHSGGVIPARESDESIKTLLHPSSWFVSHAPSFASQLLLFCFLQTTVHAQPREYSISSP